MFLEIAGSILGAPVNIILPAVLYNRAYSELHIGKDDGSQIVVRSQEFDNLELDNPQEDDILGEAVEIKLFEDKRQAYRQFNIILIVCGVIFSIVSLVMSIQKALAPRDTL